MNAAWIIARHEFVSRVRTKGFIIATVLAPLGILLLVALPIVLSQLEVSAPNRIAIWDESGRNLATKLIAADTAVFVRHRSHPRNFAQRYWPRN